MSSAALPVDLGKQHNGGVEREEGDSISIGEEKQEGLESLVKKVEGVQLTGEKEDKEREEKERKEKEEERIAALRLANQARGEAREAAEQARRTKLAARDAKARAGLLAVAEECSSRMRDRILALIRQEDADNAAFEKWLSRWEPGDDW